MKIPPILKGLLTKAVPYTEPKIDLQRVLKAHKMTAKVARLKKLYAEVKKLRDELRGIGVCMYSDGTVSVSDRCTFKAAGGVIPPSHGIHDVLRELAGATPAEGKKILAKYNIDWS